MMAKKKRQRISYVLPLPDRVEGHRLGINGLSFDQERHILYTGGRDGVVCAWDLNLDAGYTAQDDRSLPRQRNTGSFRRQVQAHTNWVNDLVLVKHGLAVVSASNDASVKLWRPHSAESGSTYTVGSHSDYVNRVCVPQSGSNLVASAGLDSKICLWDLAGGGKTLEIDLKKQKDSITKSSIYALRAQGSMVASGGPEGVVRAWDLNSGKNITKLVGHTDIVRDILISQDGDTLLTASSDQTIKVWSLTAGRCIHTLTMHNDSVWCMHSDEPDLSVFYSGDRSGLIAKTDTRRAEEIDDGVSVAICQEHDGIKRLAIAGDSIWAATSSSSLNRWKDVDTELEIQTPPASPRHERTQSDLLRNKELNTSPPSSPSHPITNGTTVIDEADLKRIPHRAALRVSNTAPHPGRKQLQPERNYSITNIRKQSEAVLEAGLFIIPVRGHPEETITGQTGLRQHRMLNDKKTILTLDTAGEVLLWDLMKCVPTKSFGKRDLSEVADELNTVESIANWCNVDTKLGQPTVTLEENYAFDAEVYAENIDIPQKIEFREDQRINLGKWVLRNLFAGLIDEEIRRDEDYRRSIRPDTAKEPTNGLSRLGAPTKISIPQAPPGIPGEVGAESAVTPRANTNKAFPQTPGLAIALAPPTASSPGATSPQPQAGNQLPIPAEGGYFDRQTTRQMTMSTAAESKDFSSNSAAATSEGSADANPSNQNEGSSTLTPASPSDEKKKSSLFGKKFQMPFPKKLGRTSTDASKAPGTSNEDKADDSDRSSEKGEATPRLYEDNFQGIIQRIRQTYLDSLERDPDGPLPIVVTPSLPIETPVLHPPPHTLIIIQEDDPESGGLTDQYRGEISQLGQDADAIEKTAPSWLGELLLRNAPPQKDPAKVSFTLKPMDGLPPVADQSNPGQSAKLNANRMLRAKKILAYVAERIDPVPQSQSQSQPQSRVAAAGPSAPSPSPPAPVIPPVVDAATIGHATTTEGNEAIPSPTTAIVPPTLSPSPSPLPPTEPQPSPSSPSSTNTTTATATTPVPAADRVLRPEEYLDLYVLGQKVDPNTTLGTLRTHYWKGQSGELELEYRANGRKEIKIPHPADVATKDEGLGTQVTQQSG